MQWMLQSCFTPDQIIQPIFRISSATTLQLNACSLRSYRKLHPPRKVCIPLVSVNLQHRRSRSIKPAVIPSCNPVFIYF